MGLRRAGWFLGCCLVVSLAMSARAAHAAVERYRGLTFCLPEGWEQLDHSDVRSGVHAGVESSDADSLAAAWQRSRRRGEKSRVILSFSPECIPVSAQQAGRVRKWVEGACGDPRRGGHNVRIRTVEVTAIDGVPAYRIRLSVSDLEAASEQLHYVMGTSRTYALAFSCEAAAYDKLEKEFESIAHSVALNDRPTLLQQRSVWLWGSILSALVGVALSWSRSAGDQRGSRRPPCSNRVFQSKAQPFLRTPPFAAT